MYIDGSWAAESDQPRCAVTNPATGEVLREVPLSSIEGCVRAAEAADRSFESWRDTPARDRSDLLYEAYRRLLDRSDELTELIVSENGKSMADASAELTYALDFLRWFAEEAVRIRGDYRLSPRGDKRIIVSKEPVGPALLITPWNYPAAMITRKIGPALAAGCPVVIKPPLETPLTAIEIVRVFDELGVPDGVVNLVTPEPAGPAVQAMLASGKIRKLSFTGSTPVGKELLAQAAKYVVRTSMELGGNAPLIVLGSADMDTAVEGAIQAKLRNGGAACTAANRIYVHQDRVAEFTSRLISKLESMTVGRGDESRHQVGALVSDAEASKVEGLVARSVEQGARLRFESSAPSDGAFVGITVLDRIRPNNVLTDVEIFGPVFPVIEFETEDEVVKMANDTEYGLVGYVFGEASDAMAVGHRLQVGMVGINRGVVSDAAAPFGGVKESGVGREGSFEGIDEYLDTKYFAVTAGRGGAH